MKKILGTIYDMTKAKMTKYIGEAKAYYKGLRFIGLSADCWTSRVGQGFIGIEISFIFLDKSTGNFVMISMCLACVYLPGSHNAVNLAAKIDEVLAAFGLSALFVIIYVSDSGGGIPAAAKVMGVKRRGCLLHTADTVTGRTVGEKGAHAVGSSRHEVKMLMDRVRGQAKVFVNATQKMEAYIASSLALKSDMEALALITGGAAPEMNPKKLAMPGATRMWSWTSLIESSFLQSSFLVQYFLDNPHERALNSIDHNEVKHLASILPVIKDIQRWSEGDNYVTSTGAWLVPQDLKAYFRQDQIGVVQSALAPGVATAMFVSSLPRLSCLVVRHLREEMTKYFPENPTDEELLAAFLDPRLKRHPLVRARMNKARTLLESRLEFALLDAFEDNEEAPATADAGAGEPGVSLLSNAQPAFAAFDPMRRFSSSAEHSGAHAAAAPHLPLFAPAVPECKTAEEKTRELAVATVAAWVSSPDVYAPVMGAGSSAFNLLDFYEKLELGRTIPAVAVGALQLVGRASFGWKASAAGPERIFSHAGLTCSALKNRYSVKMLEIMVFLKKNAKFMPSVEEVVFEMKRKKRAAKDAKRAAAKAAKAAKAEAAKAASSSSSASAGTSGGGWADADMAVDAEGDETDDEADLPDFDSSPSLSDGDVESLLSSIADSRSEVSNAEEEKDFLSFLNELERVESD